ncbi:MAG: thiolase family protein [Deltaproteobacteria bacterium]|nr:thiolase family protein [Deltaproteobacteria bacterium]
MFKNAYIPYKGYFSTPFSKWQMTLANEHSLVFGASTAARWLQGKNIDPTGFDYLYVGYTVHQRQAFYAAPWVAALIGATGTTGAAVSQACSTATTCVYNAAAGIENGLYTNTFIMTADRCSNGPHIVWPNPNGPGGEVLHENWMMDNFGSDPVAKGAMIQTAETVSKEMGATKEEADELTARRYEQYNDALANDREFQKRYFFPAEVRISKKKTVVLDQDEGITPTTLESLKGLGPVLPGGILSFGTQTHPADGNASLIVATREKAKALSADPSVEIQVCSYGYSRAAKGCMPKAPVPAANMALQKAGISVADVKAIKTHNPFIANDLYMAKEMGLDANTFNNYGSSLVFGHPQGPTIARTLIELIEELVIKGGGYGLVTGCAAGDTGAALVVKVG